ncbi:MAG: endolytic transglycosylase MltG [Thermoleophilia bacterium]
MSGRPDEPGQSGRPPAGGDWFRYEPKSPSSLPSSGDHDLDHLRHTRRQPRPGRTRARLFGYTLVALFALLLGLATGYVRGYFAEGEAGEEVTVVIASGDSLSTIAGKLQEAGVVEHAGAFVIRAQRDGYSSQLKPGKYVLRKGQPYDEIVAILIEGQAAPVVKVTIPEGSTLEQSATLVSSDLSGISAKEYTRVARDEPPAFALDGYKKGTTLEGLLFPATYEVQRTVTAEQFVNKQLDAFGDALNQVDLTRATEANLTPYDVVIIASMVEREAQVDEERAMVAAVIWNRLKADMKLQIDATVQYALGETKPVLTFEDLKVDSPYNTYTHSGLPPTPIANPGLASLQAAANPAEVDYLYYVARGDGTGRHYFSRTYEEFLANQAKAIQNSQ